MNVFRQPQHTLERLYLSAVLGTPKCSQNWICLTLYGLVACLGHWVIFVRKLAISLIMLIMIFVCFFFFMC